MTARRPILLGKSWFSLSWSPFVFLRASRMTASGLRSIVCVVSVNALMPIAFQCLFVVDVARS